MIFHIDLTFKPIIWNFVFNWRLIKLSFRIFNIFPSELYLLWNEPCIYKAHSGWNKYFVSLAHDWFVLIFQIVIFSVIRKLFSDFEQHKHYLVTVWLKKSRLLRKDPQKFMIVIPNSLNVSSVKRINGSFYWKIFNRRWKKIPIFLQIYFQNCCLIISLSFLL